ncbi:MAG: ribosomal-processing cysteine protease Prp [Clostridia bacterium]|nr:ribosomal-processing cysteine protease Prp [Clostridia bacterium]
MTKVKFSTKNGKFIGVESSGHTDFADEGSDIVCAALSSVLQTAVLGIFRIVGVNIAYETDAEKGYLYAMLPKDMTEDQEHDADVILRTAYLGVSDLYETFSDFIELEVE